APELMGIRYSSPPGVSPQDEFVGDLSSAMDAADAQRAAYLNASAQYSVLRNGSTLLGAGLGASALLLGVLGGGSQELRLGLASGALSAVGVGTLYDNRIRQAVYVNGALAIGCSIAAVAPLRVRRGFYDGLVTHTQQLAAALDELRIILPQPRQVGHAGYW